MSEQTNPAPASLAEALPLEQERVRQLLVDYESLPNGAGRFGAAFLRADLLAAEQAAASGDVVAMLRAYQKLKGCE